MQTSRAPPPNGAPPSYAFATRLYQHNLRPVVMITTFLGGLWGLFGAIGNFRASSIDHSEGFQRLANVSIALGALYAAVCAIELFGFAAAATRRLPLARIYAFLSVFGTLIIIANGLTRIIVHFTSKNDILNECTNLATGSRTAVYPYGFFGPVYHDTLDASEANEWCNRAYNHDSWSDIVAWLITIVLAVMFTVIAFAYYRQVLDPSSVANRARAPMNNFAGYGPSHYNPPYNASVPNLGYNAPYAGPPPPGQWSAYQTYAPPAGPPPGHFGGYDEDGKPPGYSGADGKAGVGYGTDRKDDDPFADFGISSSSQTEQDVTSRPAPGGRERF